MRLSHVLIALVVGASGWAGAGARAGANTQALPSASTTTGPGSDWPMFANTQLHRAIQNDPAIGTATAAHLAVKWKAPETTIAGIWSSPVVAYNATYQRPLVYSATNDGTIDARDIATGALVWSSTGNGEIVATPSVFGNTLYVGTETDRFLALDATTGALQCSMPVGGAVFSSATVAFVDDSGPVVFFGDVGNSPQAHNKGHEWAMNGVTNRNGDCTLKWSFSAWKTAGTVNNRTGSWSPPAVATDANGRPLVILGSSDNDDVVYAIDARTGALAWEFQTKIAQPDQDVGAAPAISPPGLNGFADGVVYVDGKDKIEYALDLLTGAQIWSFDLMKASHGANANAQSAAVLVRNRLIVPYAEHVFSLNPVTGKQQWISPAARGNYYASPSVSGATGQQVIVIGDASGFEHVYRLQDGHQVFEFKTHGSIYDSAAIAYGKVFFTSDDGNLYALG